MRFRGWLVAALIVVVVLGITGCTGLTHSQVRDMLTSIGKTPGVLRETHVEDSAAGYCQQTCYQGSATLVVSTKLNERGLLALRDQIAGTLESSHIDGFAMTLTLQQGRDQITLDATHAQYAVWSKLRDFAGVYKVNMDASAWDIKITNRTTVVVTGDSNAAVIPVLKYSARELVSSGVFGKRIFLTANTPDGRYSVAVDAHAIPIPFLSLDQQILIDPTLTGGSVDTSLLGGHGLVGVRVASLSALPATYLRYDAAIASYPGLYVHTVGYPGGTATIYGHLVTTDPAMVAVQYAIATNAHISGIDVEQVDGRPTSLTFDVPTDADAALVNSVILDHPELHTLSYFRVTSHADQGGTSVWDFGVASN